VGQVVEWRWHGKVSSSSTPPLLQRAATRALSEVSTQQKLQRPAVQKQKQRGRGWAAPLLGFTVADRRWDLGAAGLLGFTVVGRRWDLGAAGRMGFTVAGGRCLRAASLRARLQEARERLAASGCWDLGGESGIRFRSRDLVSVVYCRRP
jgi:hypothetical protein